MSWQDRVTEGAIETAAGDRFVFEFKDLQNSREEKATVFSFPERNLDYVQRLSSASNVFPLTMWFSGEDYDLTADAFELATQDPRPLTFQHPLREEPYTVQLISLQRDDALASAANTAQFNIVLHETLDLGTPLTSENAPLFVDNARQDMQFINSEDYSQAIALKTPSELAALQAELEELIVTVNSSLTAYTLLSDAAVEFQSILLTAGSLLTTIEDNAGAFAQVLQGLINFPSQGLEFVADKLSFFIDLIDSLDLNDPDSTRLVLSAAVTGYAQSTMDGDEDFYVTKTTVFNTIQTVLGYGQSYFNVMDQIETDYPDFEQSAEVRAKILDIVATTATSLNGISFKAKQQRSLRLASAQDIYVLVYRLLGSQNPDDLDALVLQFMEANGIKGTEMFELPAGLLVEYYV